MTMCFGACGPRCVFGARLAEEDSCAVIGSCCRLGYPSPAVHKSIADSYP